MQPAQIKGQVHRPVHALVQAQARGLILDIQQHGLGRHLEFQLIVDGAELNVFVQVQTADGRLVPRVYPPDMEGPLQEGIAPRRLRERGRGQQEPAAARQKALEHLLGFLVHGPAQPHHQTALLQVLTQQGLVERPFLETQIHEGCFRPRFSEGRAKPRTQLFLFTRPVLFPQKDQGRPPRGQTQHPLARGAGPLLTIRALHPQGEMVLTRGRQLVRDLEHCAPLHLFHPQHGNSVHLEQLGHRVDHQIHAFRRTRDGGPHQGGTVGRDRPGPAHLRGAFQLQGGVHHLLLQKFHSRADQGGEHRLVQAAQIKGQVHRPVHTGIQAQADRLVMGVEQHRLGRGREFQPVMIHLEFNALAQVQTAQRDPVRRMHRENLQHLLPERPVLQLLGKLGGNQQEPAAALQKAAKRGFGPRVHGVTQPRDQFPFFPVLVEQGIVERLVLVEQVDNRGLQPQLAEDPGEELPEALFVGPGVLIPQHDQDRPIREHRQDAQAGRSEENLSIGGVQPQEKLVLGLVGRLEVDLEHLGAVRWPYSVHGPFDHGLEFGKGADDQIRALHRAPDRGPHRGGAIGLHPQGLSHQLVVGDIQHGLLHHLLPQKHHIGFNQGPHRFGRPIQIKGQVHRPVGPGIHPQTRGLLLAVEQQGHGRSLEFQPVVVHME